MRLSVSFSLGVFVCFRLCAGLWRQGVRAREYIAGSRPPLPQVQNHESLKSVLSAIRGKHLTVQHGVFFSVSGTRAALYLRWTGLTVRRLVLAHGVADIVLLAEGRSATSTFSERFFFGLCRAGISVPSHPLRSVLGVGRYQAASETSSQGLVGTAKHPRSVYKKEYWYACW